MRLDFACLLALEHGETLRRLGLASRAPYSVIFCPYEPRNSHRRKGGICNKHVHKLGFAGRHDVPSAFVQLFMAGCAEFLVCVYGPWPCDHACETWNDCACFDGSLVMSMAGITMNDISSTRIRAQTRKLMTRKTGHNSYFAYRLSDEIIQQAGVARNGSGRADLNYLAVEQRP